jgi:predicted O-methyltransferase YrrM
MNVVGERSAQEKHALGVQLYGNARYAEAFAILEEALREGTETPSQVWNDWSVTAVACGLMDKAEEGFRRALALDSNNAQATANFSAFLARLGRSSEAVTFLRETETRAFANATATAAPASGGMVERCAGQYWFPNITGWFAENEALYLYTLVQLIRPTKILEIGTFYGRSTATICSAIRKLARPIEFLTCDLDFRSEEEFRQLFGNIHGKSNISVPTECDEAFSLGLSTLAYARRRLEEHGLGHLVRFESGDFHGIHGVFDLVFADVLHNRQEIERNLRAILSKTQDDGILAVHDLNDENIDAIRNLSAEATLIGRCEYLGIYRVHHKR